MGDSNVGVFLRLRPTPRSSKDVSVDENENSVALNLPKDLSHDYINNTREHYEFRFNGIIGESAKQDEVYERVAKKPVMAALGGINSTVFAYGQTGSGKTFTLTGGPERYADRGIIPRAISNIFQELGKRSDAQYTIHIQYMEIYNGNGFDLLDGEQNAKSYEEQPKVRFMEDEAGAFHFSNHSVHRVNSEEEALGLLFVGDTNRAIKETPMNMASSRSHCIFTLLIESNTPGEDYVRRSKLNLVDLAGSERVKKTGVDGQILRESAYISGSLQFLEMVIVALQEKSMGITRKHVPYRNCLLTCVLRDSLGGNCATTMVATANPENEHLDEMISTCRFAQRVAMIKNTPTVNEELDPTLLIRRLKEEVRQLKDELRLLRGEEEDRGPLTEGELERIRNSVAAFAGDRTGKEVSLPSTATMQHIRAGFESFRDLVVKMGRGLGPGGEGRREKDEEVKLSLGEGLGGGGKGISVDSDVLKKLQLQVQQRDNEINILVSMLKRRDGELMLNNNNNINKSISETSNSSAAARTSETQRGSAEDPMTNGHVDTSKNNNVDKSGSSPPAELLANRNRAFEVFRKSYRRNEATEENKSILRKKYAEAKSLGEAVNACRQRIQRMKQVIEQRRRRRAVESVSDGSSSASQGVEEDEEEMEARRIMEQEKEAYRQSFERLKVLKGEIEHVQKLLEQSRVRLQADFEKWYALLLRQKNQQGNAMMEGVTSSSSSSHTTRAHLLAPSQPSTSHAPKEAWGAPPPPSSSSSRPPPHPRGDSGVAIALTGNAQADQDILAFYKARDELLRSRSNR